MLNSSVDLPVWLYWEGNLPEWINNCQQTTFAHAENVHLVNPAIFEEMRAEDIDINLSQLQVAHRADFIRAFLLSKFGGLWIDSDCLVMKPLRPLLALLQHNEFMGYRERSGEVTNNFMAASIGSSIAKDYYLLVCKILRAKQPIEWLTLGSKALTYILAQTHKPWHELDVMQIQPICWSNPSAFFQKGSEKEHQEKLASDAYCYMLSANMVRGFCDQNNGANLLDEATFYTYLLKISERNRKLRTTLA
ncbi:hypothetical protein ACVWYG_000087 [Pedobacter sp. UYEF25]